MPRVGATIAREEAVASNEIQRLAAHAQEAMLEAAAFARAASSG
jgi:hypothetical protein